MLPIILVSQNLKSQKEYLEDFINTNKINPYYIFRIEPVKEEIIIDQIRLIKKEIVTSQIETRLFIISSFDNASLEVQNSLLKTLEENNDRNLFILITKNMAAILPTIRSRSQTVILEKGIQIKKMVFTDILKKTQDEKISIGQILSEKGLNAITREETLAFFDELILYFHTLLSKGRQKDAEILRKAVELKGLLQNNNLNSQLSVDNILIYIKKQYTIK